MPATERVAGTTNRAPIRVWSPLPAVLRCCSRLRSLPVGPGNGAICSGAFPPSSSRENCLRFVCILLRFWCPYAVIELFSSCLDWFVFGLVCFELEIVYSQNVSESEV